jgi:propanol-preferring alcohol dehydrogenase
MPKTMKAAVVREFCKPLVIEEAAVPEPGPGQIQVKIEASGVCHTESACSRGRLAGETQAALHSWS